MLGVATSHDASHHQDHYIFRIGDPELTLHFQLASWEGATPDPYVTKHLNPTFFWGAHRIIK